jgi:hypothetical protein
VLIAAAPAAAQEAEVWALGDAAPPNDGARRLAAYIRALEPDRFLYLGDARQLARAPERRTVHAIETARCGSRCSRRSPP